MAKIPYKGIWIKAKAYRLASSKPAYAFQHCYQHDTKNLKWMVWRGEYPNGNYTDFFIVPPSEHSHWERRIKAGEAKPEAQLMSEFSQQASRPADAVGPYLLKLTQAHRWYKGNKS